MVCMQNQKTNTREMAVCEAKIDMGSSSVEVFQTGEFKVVPITVKTRDVSKPPVELFIIAPLEEGKYPVLLFCHGYMLCHTWYTNLLQHIASHGYIVVAPKFYGLISISMPEEIKRAAQVAEWISTGLPSVLPEKVSRDMDSLAVSGHSRGGKVAFALALSKTDEPNSRKSKASIRDDPAPSNFKAVIGIDPVAGISPSNRCPPKILEYIPECFQMSIPVAVIGTGYGNQSQGMVSAFAPDGVNHSEFFNESKPPKCYFLAKEYGHCDMMDDWILDYMSYICKCGKGHKDLMRRAVGGIVVAFMKSYLAGHDHDLKDIVKDPSVSPVVLDPVIHLEE